MQPTPPGWYWDPANRPGLFCWWDGHAWHIDHVSARRDAPPPIAQEVATPVDGRYVSGGLSFPMLDGWRPCPPYPEIDGVQGQELVVGKTPRGPYLGVVFVGALPEKYGVDLGEAGMAFADDMLHMYYPHEKPHAGLDPHVEPVLGRPGWLLAVPLDIDDPSLDFEEEDALFVVVDTGERLGVLYASLPRVGDQVPTFDQLMSDLKLA